MLLWWFFFLWLLFDSFNTVAGLVLLCIICTTDANRSYADTLLALVPGCQTCLGSPSIHFSLPFPSVERRNGAEGPKICLAYGL